MADPYAKRPVVKRFGSSRTYGPRTVKEARVDRRTHPALKRGQERKGRPMRPMRTTLRMGNSMSYGIKRAE
jgi:hypothetical protein